jgi:hypothetical protein
MPEGQNAAAHIKKEDGLLPISVTIRPGTGWAAGKRVALLVLGNDPAIYGVDKGVLALVNADNTVELVGEWAKEGASSPQRPAQLDIRFETWVSCPPDA